MEQENCFPIHFPGLPQAGKLFGLFFFLGQEKSGNYDSREILIYTSLKDNLCTEAI